ncbi:hypothetical protein [Nocardioides sp. zg-DK7169]|uniref:hypothetical protein n=1 Tax=Nocardioides sp. zg-DK7169 TaxID=2736600 RepID=UPI001557A2F5|nr:hypothetical protein [Nocardioides sp. zg-DK7169]NPC97467.1 hypothetical protein [Nocardioides sp. zg-DK7169]
MQTIWFEYSDGTLGPPYSSCPQAEEAEDVAEPVVITAGMAAQALRQVDLPASELQVQPPGGRTLVNFETNFFTSADALDRTVRLLGQRVDLRIRPASFEWRFGDGSTLRTREAGAPYPDLRVTHSYLRKGAVAAAVDTTYEADFRVNGGPWAPVAGTVTMTGPAVGLEVVTATPTLMGYR